MPFADKQLVCKDCGAEFKYSARQQEHHASLGLRNEPKRCAICRQVARMRKEDRKMFPRPMGAGRPGGPRGGPPGRGGPRPGPPVPRESFIATCAACGVTTDLPFKPRGDRPVYCRACFKGARR